MHPVIHINYLAVLASVAASMALGFLWYGPLFGNVWKKEMNIPADFKPAPGAMNKPLLLMAIGSFLTAYVLAHSTEIWRASVWGVGEDSHSATYGFFAGFFTWLGFYVPLLLNKIGWEGKSWKLFFIDASFNFVALQAAGMILAFWR